ncbi:hypothetical protein V6N12_016803 [Hibiscus sabdariffa]|uniref:Uncharacterized protein n=1 Tax=Hibiscus sabdariffa TaxID=183260 RepID=A0ABR2CEN0_9ROSI
MTNRPEEIWDIIYLDPCLIAEGLSSERHHLKLHQQDGVFQQQLQRVYLFFSIDDSFIFDPTDLDIDVTPEAIDAALDEDQPSRALILSLRLNEDTLIKRCIFSVSPMDVPAVASSIPYRYLQRLKEALTDLLDLCFDGVRSSANFMEMNIRFGIHESPTESASSQETWPTAEVVAAKKTEDDCPEQSAIRRVSGADKITLRDIARERVDVISEKMHCLPDEYLDELKNQLKSFLEGNGGSLNREEFLILQMFVQNRSDLTAKTLEREDPTSTEWDRFAHGEYIRLSMEEDVDDASNGSADVWDASLEDLFCRIEGLLTGRRSRADFKQKIDALVSEIEKTAPNLKALDQYKNLQGKERDVTEEFELARKEEKQVDDAYNSVKQRRYELFMEAFDHISSNIDRIYTQLTKSGTHPLVRRVLG